LQPGIEYVTGKKSGAMKETDSEIQVKFSPSQKMNLYDLLQNVLKDPFQVEVYYIDKLCKKEETVYFTLC
jgi:hypothetical protein